MMFGIVQDASLWHSAEYVGWKAYWSKQLPVDAILYLLQLLRRIVNQTGLGLTFLKVALSSWRLERRVVAFCFSGELNQFFDVGL